jgi:hypothetical protein
MFDVEQESINPLLKRARRQRCHSGEANRPAASRIHELIEIMAAGRRPDTKYAGKQCWHRYRAAGRHIMKS